jgi:light-regulated signal transduction histidine kinase (bacteriophytochrome)
LFNNLVSNGLGRDKPETLRAHLEKINKATGRLQLLINDLLAYSRHTQTTDQFEMFSLSELLSEVISDLETEIRKTGAVIKTTPLPHLKVIPTQIRQLFQNLISNSIKFSRPGINPHIEIWCERIEGLNQVQNFDSSRDTYNIIFRDNGMGFDQQYAEEIFVVFKRLHSYHEIEGTGIGLSICKKIVERHQGIIQAAGSPGKGSTFIVSLPDLR